MEAIKSSKLQSEIEQMVGNSYLYRGRQVTVKGYGVSDGQVRIINQGNTIMFPLDRLDEELDQFMETDDPQAIERADEAKEQAVAVFQNDASQMNKLENVLVDNISKLQEDDKYLEQAKEINSTAKTLLQMSKQKLEMIREIRKAKNMGKL